MSLCYPTLWQDWCELLFITLCVYWIHLWLSRDKRMPLLLYAYGYSSIMLFTYYAPLATLIPLIPIMTPTMLMVAILIHRHSLQKDIIPYTRAMTVTPDGSWLEQILRTALSSINDDRTVMLLFECTDEITPFVDTPYTLQTKIQPDLLTLLLHPAIYPPHAMLWITHTGTLVSNKTTWRGASSHITSHTDPSVMHQKDLSILYTLKTNSMVCTIDQNSRMATLTVHGTESEQMPMHQAQKIIAKHLTIPVVHTTFSKALYEKHNETHRQQSLT
jgi:hypothetical protein